MCVLGMWSVWGDVSELQSIDTRLLRICSLYFTAPSLLLAALPTQLSTMMNRHAAGMRQVAYELPAGSLGLHDSLSPHSALPNTDPDRWRRVQPPPSTRPHLVLWVAAVVSSVFTLPESMARVAIVPCLWLRAASPAVHSRWLPDAPDPLDINRTQLSD